MFIVPFSGSPMQAELRQGEEMPLQGWYAPAYGRQVSAPMVCYSVSAPFPVRIVTLLYPMPNRTFAIPDVVVDAPDSGRPGRIMLRDRNEMIVIGDHTIAVEEM